MTYHSPDELGHLLKLSVKTIYRYLQHHEFPNRKIICRSYRIPQSDVDAFLERCTFNRKEPTP